MIVEMCTGDRELLSTLTLTITTLADDRENYTCSSGGSRGGLWGL